MSDAEPRFEVEIVVTYRFSTIEGAASAAAACIQAQRLVKQDEVSHMKVEDRTIQSISAREL